MTNMAESVSNIISDILKSSHGVSDGEASLSGELGLDSYEFIVLRERLEQYFGMSITDDELISLETVGDVVELVSTFSKNNG